jgi:translocation and assembly module TamB
VTFDKGVCEVEYRDGKLKFRNGKVELYGGEAEVEVTIGLPEVEPYSVDVSFSGVNSAPAFKLIDLDTFGLAGGKAWGEVHSSGMDFEPEGWFVYKSAGDIDTPTGRVNKAEGSYRSIDKVVYLTGFRASTERSDLSLEGYFDRKSKGISMSAQINTRNVDDVFSAYLKNTGGSGILEVKVEGTVDSPVVEGKMTIADAHVKNFPLGEVKADISYREELLSLLYARAIDGEREYEANGMIEFASARNALDFKEPKYDIDVEMAGAELNRVVKLLQGDVPVYGSMDSKFTIGGTSAEPVIKGSILVSDGDLYGRHASSLTSTFVFSQGRFKFDDALFAEGDATLKLNGSIGKDGTFEFEAVSERIPLEKISGRTMPLAFMISARAQGHGTLEDPDINLTATLTEGTYSGSNIGDGTLIARLKGREIDIESFLLRDKLSVIARAELRRDMPWSANVSVMQGRLDFLLIPLFKTVPEDLMLYITGSADIKGDRESLEASVNISRLNMNMFRQGFSNMSDILINVKGKEISMSKSTLRSGNTSLSVGGKVKIDSYYDLHFEGSSSLSPLRALSDRIKELRGNSEFVFTIQGDWENPALNGGVSLSNALLSLKKVPLRLTSVNAFIYVEGDRAVIRDFDARLGGGEVKASGFARLKRFRPEQIYLDADLVDVTTSFYKGADANLSGKLFFRSLDDVKDITGELRIKKALYRKRIDWKSWLISPGQKELPKIERDWSDNVKLNVRLSGPENILIDNNIARAFLRIDMQLTGTLGDPRLLGRIESTQGTVYFRNSELSIVSASADFADTVELGPFITVSAESNLQGYNVKLYLEGYMQQLELVLSSDPPLEEEEILALLTLGGVGGELSGLEGGIGAAEATSVITGGFQEVIEEKFKDITGVDRFQIDPYVSKETGTVTPRVTVSKRLISDKLFVTYATPMGSVEEQELKLEYILAPNVSLVGGRDDEGALGGDIKFRFRFK